MIGPGSDKKEENNRRRKRANIFGKGKYCLWRRKMENKIFFIFVIFPKSCIFRIIGLSVVLFFVFVFVFVFVFLFSLTLPATYYIQNPFVISFSKVYQIMGVSGIFICLGLCI